MFSIEPLLKIAILTVQDMFRNEKFYNATNMSRRTEQEQKNQWHSILTYFVHPPWLLSMDK